MTKQCSKCHEVRDLTEFSKKGNRRTIDASCKPCRRAYNKVHYRKNRQQYLKSATQTRIRVREFLTELKNKPCQDCGINYPHYVMDFDHRGDKKFGLNIASWRVKSRKVLLEEVAKCDLVCANCHRIRTHKPHIKEG